jgi:CxxC-x17-CxxC domain-containing protein
MLQIGHELPAAWSPEPKLRCIAPHAGRARRFPFRPTQDRPALCRVCFKKRKHAPALKKLGFGAVFHPNAMPLRKCPAAGDGGSNEKEPSPDPEEFRDFGAGALARHAALSPGTAQGRGPLIVEFASQ